MGIFWASAVGVPYLMVASMVPARRSGVYMGVLNMMIVVPMLIQTLTFGWIFEHLLDSKATNAMLLAGALFLVAALAMLWVKPPSNTDESEIVPLGAPGRDTSFYDRVVVGSDGSYSSLVGVRQAMAIARRNGAKLTIVTVYNPDRGDSSGPRAELSGIDAGRHALQRTVDDLNHDRVTTYDSVLHAGDVADGLLEAASVSTNTLVVVGNRGLGARDGGTLGIVPEKVLRNAVSDVIVVRTDETEASRSETDG